MFPSLSSCDPSSLVTSSFVANRSTTLTIAHSVTLTEPNVFYAKTTLNVPAGTVTFFYNPVVAPAVGINPTNADPIYISNNLYPEARAAVFMKNYNTIPETYTYLIENVDYIKTPVTIFGQLFYQYTKITYPLIGGNIHWHITNSRYYLTGPLSDPAQVTVIVDGVTLTYQSTWFYDRYRYYIAFLWNAPLNSVIQVIDPGSVQTGFLIKTITTGKNHLNPDIYLIQGRTYKFALDCPGNPFYLTTTSGVEYNDGLRYTLYSRSSKDFYARSPWALYNQNFPLLHVPTGERNFVRRDITFAGVANINEIAVFTVHQITGAVTYLKRNVDFEVVTHTLSEQTGSGWANELQRWNLTPPQANGLNFIGWRFYADRPNELLWLSNTQFEAGSALLPLFNYKASVKGRLLLPNKEFFIDYTNNRIAFYQATSSGSGNFYTFFFAPAPQAAIYPLLPRWDIPITSYDSFRTSWFLRESNGPNVTYRLLSINVDYTLTVVDIGGILHNRWDFIMPSTPAPAGVTRNWYLLTSRYYFLMPVGDPNNFVVRCSNIILTYNDQWYYDPINYILSLRFSAPIGSAIEVQDSGAKGFNEGDEIKLETYPGFDGYAIFTPPSTAPGILHYKSRSGLYTGNLIINPSAMVFSPSTPIKVKELDKVSVTVPTSGAYLGVIFYEYITQSSPKIYNYFAVVNKNNYNPLIKSVDRLKRFYNYVNYGSYISLYNTNTQYEVYNSQFGLATGDTNGNVDIAYSHIVLDVVNSKVNFYTPQGGLTKSVYLNDFPIQYEKFNYTVGGIEKTDLFVLTADGVLNRIYQNLKVERYEKFAPYVRSTAFLDANLPVNEDIPFTGTFTTAARRKLTSSLFPVVTGFTFFSSSQAFLVGASSIAKMNVITRTVSSIMPVAIDPILHVTNFDNSGVIVTTTTHKIYYVRADASFVNLTPGGGPFVLGMPCTMPFAMDSRAVIPDSHNHRLIVINGIMPSDITFINLGDFVPAYARRFGDDVYVTGHDSNEVIKIEVTDVLDYFLTETNATRITRYALTSKVTLVSVINVSMLGHHYLFNRQTLDFAGTGIKKIIPVEFPDREGPGSTISAPPRVIRTLGEDPITPVPGPYMGWWKSGTNRGDLLDGDYLGINFRGAAAGINNSVLVVGEHALDFSANVVSSSSYLEHFKAGVYSVNLIVPPVNVNYTPPISVLGVYTLPFPINYFGTVYNQFRLGINGMLSFDLAFPIDAIVPGFVAATTDVLLVEPSLIYQDRPIDNRIVNAVTWAALAGGATPGVNDFTDLSLGEFQAYKLEFTGIKNINNPNGIVRVTEPIAQTGTEINMANTTGIAVLDYVSNPISSPGPPYATIVSTGPVTGNPGLQVVNLTTYAATATGYHTTGSNIYLDSTPGGYKTYSKIALSGALIGYYSGNSSTLTLSGNSIISVDNFTNTLIVKGITDNQVTNKFIFEVTTIETTTVKDRGLAPPYFTNILSSTAISTLDTIITASAVNRVTTTFSPVKALIADSNIQVSSSIYNSINIGMDLTSSLYAGTDTVIAKHTNVKTFDLEINPQMAVETQTIIIDFTTTGVIDGTWFDFNIEPGNFLPPKGKVTIGGAASDFDPIWTVVWPNTARPSGSIPAGPTFPFEMYGGHVRIFIPVRQDFTAEPIEDYKVKITGINPGSSDFISLPDPTFYNTINFASVVIGPSAVSGGVKATQISYNEYFLQFTGTYTSSLTDTFAVEYTEISFSSPLPASIKTGATVTITNGLDGLPNTADDLETTISYTASISYTIYTIETIDPAVPLLTTLSTIDFTGDFVTLDYSQTLPASTPMLFKAYLTPNPVQYQVAFYVGRGYQYIEYSYRGQPEHDQTLTIGLRDSAGINQVQIPGTPLGPYSYLFGGDISTGDFNNIGGGSFSEIVANGFVPRYPRIFRERVFDDTWCRYDVYIDFKIPSTSDVRASIDYGYMRIDDKVYDGSYSIKEGDVISIFVPFGDNRPVSSVILSLGSAQFAIPVAPEKDLKSKETRIIKIPNQLVQQNLTYTFPIDVTGRYHIPEYYKSALTNVSDMIFDRLMYGAYQDTLVASQYYDLLGDLGSGLGSYHLLNISKIFTGYRNYNINEIVIAGPVIHRIQFETQGQPDLVNFLDYGEITDYFTAQKKPADLLVYDTPTIFLPGLEKVANINQISTSVVATSFTETFDHYNSVPAIESKQLTLNFSSGVPGNSVNLFASGSNATFIVNGIRTGSRDIQAVTGDSIALEWPIYSYHESNITIWQVTTDPSDSSNVYTAVGSWRILQKDLDPLFIMQDANIGRSLQNVFLSNIGFGYDRDTVAIEFSAPDKPNGITAEGYALLIEPDGTIEKIVITNAGSGYSQPAQVFITGANSIVASAYTVLADNILPRETYLTNYFDKIKEEQADSVKITREFSYFTAGFDAVSNVESIKSNVEQSYFTKSTSTKLISGDTFFTGLTQQKTESISYLFSSKAAIWSNSQIAFVKLNSLSKQLQNTIFSSRLQNQPKIGGLATLVGRQGFVKYVFDTIFTSKNSYQYVQFKLVSNTAPSSRLARAATQISGYQSEKFLPVETILSRFMDYSYLESTAPFYKDITPFERVTTIELFTSMPEYKFFSIEMYDSALNGYELVKETMINGDKFDYEYNTITVFYSQRPDYDLSTTEVITVPPMGYELAPITVLDENPTTYGFISIESVTSLIPFDFNPNATILEVGPFDYSYFTVPIIGEDLLPETLSPTVFYVDPGTYLYTGLTTSELDMEYVLEIGSGVPYQLEPEIYRPTYFTKELIEDLENHYSHFGYLEPEWLYQDKHFQKLPPELLFQDKIFYDFPPELLFQDKIFYDFPPELLFQDKIFYDFPPELLENDKLFIDFDPLLGDPGNRYIDFPPLMLPRPEIFVDFKPRLQLENYIEIFIEPISVISQLYIQSAPEWQQLKDANNVFIEMTKVKDEPPLNYMDDFTTYGAFKSEFLIYADEGRGGDLGTYQGSPLGTPGRTRGPILPYTELMGSALVSKTVNYGLGGFTDYASAALVAAKYVNARAFQVLATNVWNYRIYFNRKVFSTKRSRIFPRIWYIKGG